MRFFVLLLFFPLVVSAEPATVIRATDLKQEPASDAATIASLPENSVVEALERRSGWTRVKAPAGAGWVRMLSLRFDAAKPGASGASQLFNVARTGSSGTQTTTGVRGLDEQQLAAARPNPAELAKLQQFAADRAAAARFAAEGKLEAKTVDYPQP